MAPREQMTVKTIRVPPRLWDAAIAAATERDENLSEEIRRFLTRYINKK